MLARKALVRPIVIPAVALVVAVLAWELADRLFAFNKLILPSPSEIASAFAAHWRRLFADTAITMLESILGFGLGSIVAFVLAIVFIHSRLIQEAVYPYTVALKSTPLIAVAPLLVLWCGNGLFSKIVMSALVAFFPVLVNAVNGLTAVEREVLDLMKSLSATRMQVLLKIRIPNSLGYVFASLKIASSLAVVGAVIGEFTGATRGIGHLINTSSYYLDTPLMFAGIVMISVSGILFFGVVAYVERIVVFWNDRRIEA
jgi:NitT/TauT family transport system permease protein